MKLLLSSIAAAIVAGTLLAVPAEARCWFNGHGWQCSHPVKQAPKHHLPSPSWGY